MKKLVFLLLLSMGVHYCQAQYQENNSYGTQAKRGKFDSTLLIPTGCGTPTGWASLKSVPKKQAAKYYDSCGGKEYTFNPKDSSWKITGEGIQTIHWDSVKFKPANFNTTYALSGDVIDSILKRLAIRDTSAMLNSYKAGIIALNADTATLAARFSNIVSLVGTKLNLSDTSGMLNAYKVKNIAQDAAINLRVNYSDTSGMLNAYKLKDIAHDALLALKMNFTDSAGMLNAYRLKDISHDASITALNNDTATLAARFTNVINLANSRQASLGFTPENAANKGAANGYAPLGSDTKIATTYLPSITMNNVFTAATQSAMLALSAVVGDMCVRTDSSISYILQVANPSNPASWVKVLSPAAPVSSVNGFTGSVSLLTSNISEGGLNYYWTAARSRAAQSLTVTGSSGAATYDNTTGVLNIPTYTLAGLGGQPQLNGTGFVKASGTTITYDNSTYLTGNQTITLSGDISGSGTTAITTTIGASRVTNAMLAGSIDYAKMNAATVPTWNQNTSGNAATATLAANSTLWNGQVLDLANLASLNIQPLVYDITNAQIRPATQFNLRTFLDLGSNAYTSTAYLPLSGGTLTGGLTGTSANFTNDINAYSVGLNGSAGGWARHYSFIGSSGTNRGGFGAFGSDNTLSYYYIGNAYNDYKVRVEASTGAVSFASDIAPSGQIYMANNTDLFFRNSANNAWIQAIGLTNTDRIRIGSGGQNVDVGGVFTSTGTIYAGATGGNIYLTGTTAGQVSMSGSTMYLADWATGTKGLVMNLSTGAATFSHGVTASSFIKSGGTSSQYLMADGSVSSSSDFVPYAGATASLDMGAYSVQANVITSTSNIYNAYVTFPVTALNTDYLIPGAHRGMLKISDISYGGTALYLIDTITGTFTTIASNLVGTYTLVFSSNQWYLRKTAGSVPSTISWTAYQ